MFIEVTSQVADYKYKRILNTDYIRAVYEAGLGEPVTIELENQTAITVIEDYMTIRTWLESSVTMSV